tara:strand:+ start:391 stop:1008 length:618 start_codon:yes stop_codon:yes gene_type:complete
MVFKLINPIIEGSMKKEIDAENELEAANNLWKKLSKYFLGGVPRFRFSIKKEKDGKIEYFHFEVKEDEETGKYTIYKKEEDINKEEIEEFENTVSEYMKMIEHSKEKKEQKQEGGYKKPSRKRYSSTSSSDSDSASDTINIVSEQYPVIRRSSPITFFHYNYRLYDKYELERRRRSTLNPKIKVLKVPIYTPTFTLKTRPFIALY